MSDVHDRLVERGIDRDRLDQLLANGDNWGAMVHAFEWLAVASAVLATWPEEAL